MCGGMDGSLLRVVDPGADAGVRRQRLPDPQTEGKRQKASCPDGRAAQCSAEVRNCRAGRTTRVDR